jgi:hypothetical protein
MRCVPPRGWLGQDTTVRKLDQAWKLSRLNKRLTHFEVKVAKALHFGRVPKERCDDPDGVLREEPSRTADGRFHIGIPCHQNGNRCFPRREQLYELHGHGDVGFLLLRTLEGSPAVRAAYVLVLELRHRDRHAGALQGGDVGPVPVHHALVMDGAMSHPCGEIMNLPQLGPASQPASDRLREALAELAQVEPFTWLLRQPLHLAQRVVEVEAIDDERHPLGYSVHIRSLCKKTPRPADRGGPRFYPRGCNALKITVPYTQVKELRGLRVRLWKAMA